MVLSPCRGSISGFLGSFQSGGAFLGQRALTIECSVMSGCDQGHEPTKKLLKEAVDQVSQANSRQKWKYKSKKVGLVYTRPINLVYNGLPDVIWCVMTYSSNEYDDMS